MKKINYSLKSEKGGKVGKMMGLIVYAASLLLWYAVFTMFIQFTLTYITSAMQGTDSSNVAMNLIVATIMVSVFGSFLVFMWWTPNKINKYILKIFGKEPYPFWAKK